MNKKGRNIWPLTILIIILSLSLLFLGGFSNSIMRERNLYKTILRADSDLAEISIDSQQAESYYLEASYAYEDMDYKEVEKNCRLARNYFFEESQGYKRIKAYLNNKYSNDKLIILYMEQLDLLSEISINMFEACEHFEVAARYYDTYFNSGVDYNDASYDMGSQEMEMMNKKIKAHDNAVEKYNNKLAEFQIELKKEIK